LRVDLDSLVRHESFSEHTPMLTQCICISVAKLPQQLRRAFDVREEEGDRAGRQLAHR
jgi:hypothetical protein